MYFIRQRKNQASFSGMHVCTKAMHLRGIAVVKGVGGRSKGKYLQPHGNPG